VHLGRYPFAGPPNIRRPRRLAGMGLAAPTAEIDLAGGEQTMGIVLLVLLLALILVGAGFALHVLWWIALIVLAIWLVGFLFRTGEGARWYRW
jgi:hypothetical protein